MLDRLPALLAALCLSVYWFWVIVKLVRLARKLGKDPNAMPRERVGQLMRFLWYPIVLVLLTGLWLTASVSQAKLAAWGGGGMPGQGTAAATSVTAHSPAWFGWLIVWLWPPSTLWWAAAIPAGVVCLLCTAATFVCWRKMGRSWRIGIDPKEKLALVLTGPYGYVRHPIYALRMVINICAMIMAPTLLVILPAAIDFVLMQIEARREERYMERKHGGVYREYKKSVGRFVPRAFVV